MSLDPELISILRCPKCKGRLELKDERGFACATCNLLYPIVDDIPNFLISEAQPLHEQPLQAPPQEPSQMPSQE